MVGYIIKKEMKMAKPMMIEVGSLLTEGDIFIGDAKKFAPTAGGVTEEWTGDFAQVRHQDQDRIATLLHVDEGFWEVFASVDVNGDVVEFILKKSKVDTKVPSEIPTVLKV